MVNNHFTGIILFLPIFRVLQGALISYKLYGHESDLITAPVIIAPSLVFDSPVKQN